jgi:hypothetical protein
MFQARSLLAGGDAASQQTPHSGLDPTAETDHKPFERAAAKQQNFMRQ